MASITNVTITCARGIEPRLLELEQHSTYRGLLDGGPNHELNEQILAEVAGRAGRIPTHLVRPAERLIGGSRPSPYGPLVHLPEHVCTGLFDLGGRRLTIVWFQDSWAPPIDDVVLTELEELDFLVLAFDEVGSW